MLQIDNHEVAHNVHAYSINFSQNYCNLSRLTFQNFPVGACPQTFLDRSCFVSSFLAYLTINFSSPSGNPGSAPDPSKSIMKQSHEKSMSDIISVVVIAIVIWLYSVQH